MRQESTPSKTGKIKESTVDELKQALRYVMLKVGIRAANLPTDEERDILLEHIFKHYGGHTPEEIKLAFDLAITDKLELEMKDVTCYENFSCLYFSTIMNAYRNWFAMKCKNGQIESVKQTLIEYKPDIEKINQEYEAFLKTPLGQRLNPKI